MKKIFITFSLMAMLIAVSCDTSKKGVAAVATPPPPEAPAKPVKGEMKESTMKVATTPQYEKKALPQKSLRAKPMETAEIIPDTIH